MRKAVAVPKERAEHVGRTRGRHVEHKHGIEAHEVDEDGLPVASVAAVSGMLRHIGVDDDAVRGRVAEAERLVGLDLAEGLPTAGRAWHVFVYGTVDVRHERAAARTVRLGRAHVVVWVAMIWATRMLENISGLLKFRRTQRSGSHTLGSIWLAAVDDDATCRVDAHNLCLRAAFRQPPQPQDELHVVASAGLAAAVTRQQRVPRETAGR